MLALPMKFLLAFALLNSVSGRVLMVPKFYGQDSAIIVDTDKSLQSRLNPKLHNALYYNIPVYKLFKPGNVAQTVTSSTTTAAPTALVEEYPSDLLNIARNKLGLKRLDQLPSLSDLGELLGTGNAEETIKYIRALTSNDQGIALMKAYLGSLDYDQSVSEEDTKPKYNEDGNDTDNADIDADYDDASTVPLKQPKLDTVKAVQWDEGGSGLMQRVNDFMKQYGMWSDETTTPAPINYKPVFVAPQLATVRAPRPLLLQQPLPYHYPVPLRPAVKTTPTTVSSTTATPQRSTQAASVSPHLNSPKEPISLANSHVAPHIQQLAEIANIPPSVLDTFLQQQPKLAELAKRVSRLPLVQQHNRAINEQLFVAVKKAISQDENLKRLLSASQTLK